MYDVADSVCIDSGGVCFCMIGIVWQSVGTVWQKLADKAVHKQRLQA